MVSPRLRPTSPAHRCRDSHPSDLGRERRKGGGGDALKGCLWCAACAQSGGSPGPVQMFCAAALRRRRLSSGDPDSAYSSVRLTAAAFCTYRLQYCVVMMMQCRSIENVRSKFVLFLSTKVCNQSNQHESVCSEQRLQPHP